MANKFEQMITMTGNKALKARAAQIVTTARIAYQNKVNTLLNEKTQLELKLAECMDLAPTNTFATTPNATNFNAEEWVETIQDLEVKIWKVGIELEIAERNYKNFFEEIVEEKKESKKSK